MRAIGPAPAIAALAQQGVARRRIGHDAHPQTITLTGQAARQGLGNHPRAHQPHRGRRQQTHAVILTAVGQQHRKARVGLDGGDEAAATGIQHRCIEAVRIRVGRDALIALHIQSGHAGTLCIGRPEGGVFHTQRRKDPLLRKLAKPLACSNLDNARQQLKACQAAVRPARAGLKLQRHSSQIF